MSGRNPDLPILDELGAEFEEMVSAAWTAVAPGATVLDRHAVRRRAAAPPSSAGRERGAQARRVGRRAAIILVLICLVGGVAFAALRSGGSSGAGHTAPALLGRDGGGAWSFSVYRDEGRLCTVFVPRGGELSGSCGAAPGQGRLRAGSAIAAGRRYVFGVTGAGVGRVSASLTAAGGGRSAISATAPAGVQNPVDPAAASDAGLPVGDGWFVIDLGPVHHAGGAPAVVTPLDRHGRRAGPNYVDCSLGVISPACARRIESAARG